MTSEHVIHVDVDRERYAVLARRELTEKDAPCCGCGKSAAGVKLIAVEIYSKTTQVTDSAVREAVKRVVSTHPFARPVCGSPRCYSMFLGSINVLDEMYRCLHVA